VDYGTFLDMVDKGKVDTVEIQENQIVFIVYNDESEKSVYVTGLMDDPDLEDRPYEKWPEKKFTSWLCILLKKRQIAVKNSWRFCRDSVVFNNSPWGNG